MNTKGNGGKAHSEYMEVKDLVCNSAATNTRNDPGMPQKYSITGPSLAPLRVIWQAGLYFTKQ